MNAYHPTHRSEVDAVTPRVGLFPTQRNTVRAEVLARLINGEVLTGMNAVFSSSTTRLAAVVHALRTSYRWPIESVEKVVSTNDGRTAEISAYLLPSPIAMAAMTRGGAEYCASVKESRLALRMAKKPH